MIVLDVAVVLTVLIVFVRLWRGDMDFDFVFVDLLSVLRLVLIDLLDFARFAGDLDRDRGC